MPWNLALVVKGNDLRLDLLLLLLVLLGVSELFVFETSINFDLLAKLLLCLVLQQASFQTVT